MIEGTLSEVDPQAEQQRRTGLPPIAVEISAEGILAASRDPQSGQLRYAFVELNPGDLVTGYLENNVRNQDAVVTALRMALVQVSPRRAAVSIVVPDRTSRVSIVGFDTLPPRREDVTSLLRYRLRRGAPFDLDRATISYQLLGNEPDSSEVQPGAQAYRLLTVMTPASIVAEYESAVRAAGYTPGAVLPSTIASLRAFDCREGALAINVASDCLTISIARANELLLYRNIGLPAEAAASIEELERNLAVAIAWYEDHLGNVPDRFCYSGSVSTGAGPAVMRELPLAANLLGRGEAPAAPQMGFAAVVGALGAAVAEHEAVSI